MNMRHTAWPLALAAALTAGVVPGARPAGAAVGGAAAAGGAGLAHGEVRVAVDHLRSDRGTIMACLTADPARFPRCRNDRAALRLVIPAKGSHELVFADVPPGTYALALLHDENGNGEADRAASMIPREGFGFSRNAPARLGPPRFRDAAFAVRGGSQRLAVRMRYML